ncbi:hypothetical protein ACFV16_38320 [Streptomyces massasporeus]|uniref:hypothetical protein n=1 Tax=Streptomyces massasporeus TaxID=67324 RepID=UPI003679E095
MTPTLELALALQAVLDAHDAASATITRLREQTQTAGYAYSTIASFIADFPLPTDHTALQRTANR